MIVTLISILQILTAVTLVHSTATPAPQQDFFYNTGARGTNQYVSVQQGNQFGAAQYYTSNNGDVVATSYHHQPSANGFDVSRQFDPYQPFHTNQHLPQPFHTVSPPAFQPTYYEPRPTGGLVDQLDTGSRWRRPDPWSASDRLGPTTLRPRILSTATAETASPPTPTRSKTRTRTRTDTKVKPTTYTPNSTPAALQRQRSRYSRPDIITSRTRAPTTTQTTTTSVPSTTTEAAIEYDLYDYELAPQNEADGPISIDQLDLGPPAPAIRPARPANATFYDVFKPFKEYERDPEPAVDPYKLVPEPTVTTYRARIPSMSTTTTTTLAPTTSPAEGNGETEDDVASVKRPPPPGGEDSGQPTESWVIVASVQTSRSVSGARFLPGGVIEQEEQPKPRTPNGGIEKSPTGSGNPEEEEGIGANENNSDNKPLVSSVTSSSTESIIDKLDRVQSELSSGILGFSHGDNKLELEPLPDMANDKVELSSTTSSPATITTIHAPVVTTVQTTTASTTPSTTTTTEDSSSEQVFVRKFVPSARRITSTTTAKPTVKKSILDAIEFDDLTGLLPPGFKVRTFKPKTAKTTTTTSTTTTTEATAPQAESKSREGSGRSTGLSLGNRIKLEDVSAFLPPGFKATSTTTQRSKPKSVEDILGKITFDDISSLLPPGYNQKVAPSTKEDKSKKEPVVKAFDLPPALLPPGYKSPSEDAGATNNSSPLDSILSKVKFQEVDSLLPPGYKDQSSPSTSTVSTAPKVVFPTRPGSASPSSPAFSSSTTKKTPPPRTSGSNPKSAGGLVPLQPKINKGWPVRATTEFTGWPTPSTTPISVEKILAAAKAAAATSTTTTEEPSTTAKTTTTTTTTTTRRPTTPGICTADCDMAATIRLTGPKAKWMPELLDHNTIEYQQMANEITNQLDSIYSSSDSLSRWYKKINIDAFSEGSIIVDYFVELSELGRTVSTADMKRLFHESLDKYTTNQEVLTDTRPRTAASTSANSTKEYRLGKFNVDPNYTDFIVLPKRVVPTVGFAEDEELLPQWAIAVIVIGLASLLFVIIFGVTVLVNRHKGAKKKQPSGGLTEDMLHQLNKGHLTGIDNYAADPADLYNMEDVWNDKPIKKRSSGSMQENSMANLYDSWRSEWNGYYYNNGYYGNAGYPPGTGGYPITNGGYPGGNGYGGASSTSGYSRRRSDYDTNF